MGYVALEGRYELVRELGRGGQGVTWEARALEDGRLVAIKMLDLKDVQDWKQVELIEREAKTLQSLDHPAIPDYVDFIRDEQEDGQLRLFMVQELVQGKTLEQELREQGRWDEAKLKQDAEQLLKILDYLHKRVPPVIHRDIKPSNIIRSQDDGRLYLIDFGAVRGDQERSTMIGTPGYMPLEQLVNRTEPRSDLYSLGVTLFRLLTGVEPIDVELRDGKLDYMALVERPTALARLLSLMTQPNKEDRVPSAQRALELLNNPSLSPDEPVEDGGRGLVEAERAPLLDALYQRDQAKPVHGFRVTKTGWMPVAPEQLDPSFHAAIKVHGLSFVGRHLAMVKQDWASFLTRGALYKLDVQIWCEPNGEVYVLTMPNGEHALIAVLEDGRRVFMGDVEAELGEETIVLERKLPLAIDLEAMRAFIKSCGVRPLRGLNAREVFKAASPYFMPQRSPLLGMAWPIWFAIPMFILFFWLLVPLYLFLVMFPYWEGVKALDGSGKLEDPIKYAASLKPSASDRGAESAQVTLDFEGAQAAQEEMAQHELSHQASAKP